MTEIFTAGLDGGAVTGFAVWGQAGLVMHTQGTVRQVLREAREFIKARREQLMCIGVEAGWVARETEKIGGSATALRTEGFITGVLWAMAVPDERVWLCEPAEWRKIVGITTHVPGPNGKKRRCSSDEMKQFARERYAAHLGVRAETIPKNQEHAAEATCIAEAAYRRWRGRQMVSNGLLNASR